MAPFYLMMKERIRNKKGSGGTVVMTDEDDEDFRLP